MPAGGSVDSEEWTPLNGGQVQVQVVSRQKTQLDPPSPNGPIAFALRLEGELTAC
jgi:hypothetical protein